MRSNSERRYEVDSYDKAADHIADSVFETLNIKEENNSETKDINPTNNKYNAVHIAKTGRKAISHGANRWPGGPGSAKMLLEAIFGKTVGGENLSPTERKLYGLGSGISLIGWLLFRLGVQTGNLRLTLPTGALTPISSVLCAAAQASIVGGNTNIGVIFKTKINEYLNSLKAAIQKLKSKSIIDQQSQEQIAAVEATIQEVESIIAQTTDQEAGEIAKHITTELPGNKNTADQIQERSSKKQNKIPEMHYEKGKFYGRFLDNYEFVTEGSESTVYKSKDGSHVIKISEPYNSPEESLYNNRIQETLLGNTLFGNLNLEVIGYYEHNGIKNPIYQQTYIQGEEISEEEAKQYLKTHGATEINGKIYYKYNNEIYEINDFYENYIKDKNGTIYGMDVTMFKPSNIGDITL